MTTRSPTFVAALMPPSWERIARPGARQPVLDRDGFLQARVVVRDGIVDEEQGTAVLQLGSVQQDGLDEPQVGEAQAVILFRVLIHSRALARFPDELIRRVEEETRDGSAEQDAWRWADDLTATEADDRKMAAGDA
jgi:hypothetical protein